MSETRNKLEEARFFLRTLERSASTLPDFHYYLSAYISAARSVLWVMGSEYDGNCRWRTWYDSKDPPPADLAFLKGTSALRGRAVKLQTPSTSTRLTLAIDPKNFTPELRYFLENHQDEKLQGFTFLVRIVRRLLTTDRRRFREFLIRSFMSWRSFQTKTWWKSVGDTWPG